MRSLTTMPGATGSTANDISTVTMMIGRRDDEHGFVGERRNPVLLEENLDHVRQYLQQPERTDAIRAVAVLPERQQPPLQPDQPGGDSERDDQNADDREDGIRLVMARRNPAPRRKVEAGKPAARPPERRLTVRQIGQRFDRETLGRTVPLRLPKLDGILRVQSDIRFGRQFRDGRRRAAQFFGTENVVAAERTSHSPCRGFERRRRCRRI